VKLSDDVKGEEREKRKREKKERKGERSKKRQILIMKYRIQRSQKNEEKSIVDLIVAIDYFSVWVRQEKKSYSWMIPMMRKKWKRVFSCQI
jgi:hypothetical protein